MTARPYLSRHRLDVVLAIATALGTFGAEWFRHATFRSSTYDLGVFEQVVWKMAHGHGATSSLTAWNTFGDHVSPVLLVFVPLFRLAATPLWFFGAQAIAIGIAVLCVRPLATSAGLIDRPFATNAMVVIAACNPAIWNAVFYDFHPTTLAVPFIMLGITAGLRHDHRVMWLSMAGLVFLRDDLALAGVTFALVGWTTDSRAGRRQRIGLASAGLAWIVIGAQIGTALGASRHFVARYGYLGDSMTDAAMHPVHAFVGLVQHVVSPENALLVIVSLAALACLPILKPGWAFLAVVVSLPMLAANDANLHSYSFHYGAPVAPFLFLAAAGGLARVNLDTARRWTRLAVPLAASSLVFMGPAATKSLTLATVNAADARAAVATVRTADVVSADNTVATHLADRASLVPFPFPFVRVKAKFPLDPRVTSTSQESQAAVNVVVVHAPITEDDYRLLAAFRKAIGPQAFTETDFGSVLVFRRK